MSDADRAAMLAGVEGLVIALARKAGGTADDKEDRAQELRLLAWKLTATFDPTRGAKWSSYFMAAAKRVVETERVRQLNRPEVLRDDPADWGDVPDPASLGGPEPEPDTEGELHAAVRTALTEGLLARCSPLEREVCGLVVAGDSPARIADRLGKSVRVVKLVMRNAARRLTRQPAAAA